MYRLYRVSKSRIIQLRKQESINRIMKNNGNNLIMCIYLDKVFVKNVIVQSDSGMCDEERVDSTRLHHHLRPQS